MKPHACRRSFLRAFLVHGLVCGSLVLGASAAHADRSHLRFAVHCKPMLDPSEAVPHLCDKPETPAVEPNYSPNFTNTPCSDYVTGAPLGPSLVYVVVARAGSEGILGASFGVEYDGGEGVGIDSRFVRWNSCTDGLEFPNAGAHGEFPASGGGLRITWVTCQTELIPPEGVHVVVGTFYVYAYSDALLSLTPNYNVEISPEITVADCGGAESNMFQAWSGESLSNFMGSAGFGHRSGTNVCADIPVPGSRTTGTPTTWGRVKTLYRPSTP